MRDDDKTIVWSVGGLEELSHLPHSIYIKSWVDFVEDNIFWIKKLDLKDFDFSLFSSAKSYIKISPEEIFWNFEFLHQRFNDFFEREKCRWGLGFRIINGFKEFKELYTWDFWDILECKEYSSSSSLIWRHFIQNLTVKLDSPISNLILWIPRDKHSKRRLPWSIFSKDTVIFPWLKVKRNRMQNFFIFNLCWQISNF